MAYAARPAASERPAARLGAAPGRHSVNLRSVALGLVAVVMISAITPYNDYALDSTYFIGNFLPIGLLLLILFFLAAVNAPLRRWAPSLAFDSGELSVSLGMALVACALPSSGLMRYLPASLVGLWVKGDQSRDYLTLLTETLHLPQWLFPAFGDDSNHAMAPVVNDYWYRSPVESDTFVAHLAAVPWALWRQPAIAWGLLCAMVFGAILCATFAIRRQWVENERLPFPLAGVYLALIEQPTAGEVFPPLFRSGAFWLAAGLVFVLHSINVLHVYFASLVPQVPLRYDFTAMFGTPPISSLSLSAKSATIYFCMVGITFFLQSQIAFSLWSFFIFTEISRVYLGSQGATLTAAMQQDQTFGAAIAFTMMILWIGRAHWMLVIRQMFRGVRDGEARGSYMPYALSGWGLIFCLAGCIAWLAAAGASVVGAIVAVAFLGMLLLCAARVVAETGLIFVQITVPAARPWVLMMQDVPGAVHTTPGSLFMTNWLHGLFAHDMRESLAIFAPHAVRIADATRGERDASGRKWGFVASLVLALVVGFLISGASTLVVEYSYAQTQSASPSGPINAYGVVDSPNRILNETVQCLPPRTGPNQAHSHLQHLGFGVGVTAVLAFLRLRFTAWPFHPVGMLMAHSFPMSRIWFSVMIGWILKTLIVRFSGASGFRRAAPFFLGLIVGEAGTAGFWMVFSLLRHLMGLPYYRLNLLPT